MSAPKKETMFEKIKRERAEKEAAAKAAQGGTTTEAVTLASPAPVASPSVQPASTPKVEAPPTTPTPIAQATTLPVATPQVVQQPQTSVITQPKAAPVASNLAYDDAPITEEEGLGIMIYGPKNGSKTTTALSVTLLPTKLHPNPTVEAPNEYKIACLSFDLQTNRIKKEIFKDNPNIVVFDPLKYRTKETDDDNLTSAVKTFNYIRHLLTSKSMTNPFDGAIYLGDFDFILIDGLEIFKETFEMAMKAMLNIPVYGLADWTCWRKRTDLMDDIDVICKRLPKKAVIYTSYTTFREVKEKNSGVVTLVEPKWAGNTKTKTGIVIRTEVVQGQNGKEYLAHVEGSKVLSMPTTNSALKIGYIEAGNKPVVIGLRALGNL